MTGILKILCMCMLFLVVTAPVGRADSEVIEQLSGAIAAAKSDDDKSRLHIFRARNYRNQGNMEMAERDYDAALAYDHKGWIHLERSRFYMALGEYRQARLEAKAAQKETPTLQGETEKLIARAEKELQKEKRVDNPREIVLTRKWEARYSRGPRTANPGSRNVREAYAARNKAREASRPSRVSRS